MEHTGARPKEIKVPQRRASAVKTAPKGNRQPGNITEALRNSTESIEIAPDVHSTTQMPGKLSLVKKQSLYTLLHQNAHTLK